MSIFLPSKILLFLSYHSTQRTAKFAHLHKILHSLSLPKPSTSICRKSAKQVSPNQVLPTMLNRRLQRYLANSQQNDPEESASQILLSGELERETESKSPRSPARGSSSQSIGSLRKWKDHERLELMLVASIFLHWCGSNGSYSSELAPFFSVSIIRWQRCRFSPFKHYRL